MQHPEEGLIHAWLDGALPAGESARIEEHVASCDACASAVAEARGLIAASSRIIGHLDTVPGNVIPLSTGKRSRLISRAPWLAGLAAALLISVKLYVDKPSSPSASDISASTSAAAEMAARRIADSSPVAVTRPVAPPPERVAQSPALPPPNAAMQKSSVAVAQPASPPVPIANQQRADEPRAAAQQPARALARSAAGSLAAGASADRTLEAAAVAADTAFVGCYEFLSAPGTLPAPTAIASGVTSRSARAPAAAVGDVSGGALDYRFERFALTDEAAPTRGLFTVRQLDAAGRPDRTIVGAGWTADNGRGVLRDPNGRAIVTLVKLDSTIRAVRTSDGRIARVISCR